MQSPIAIVAKTDCTNRPLVNMLLGGLQADGCAGVSLAKIAQLSLLHTGFKSPPIRTHLYYILHMYNYEFFSHKYITDVYKCNLAKKPRQFRRIRPFRALVIQRIFLFNFLPFPLANAQKSFTVILVETAQRRHKPGQTQ
jgi:hypothetical protein